MPRPHTAHEKLNAIRLQHHQIVATTWPASWSARTGSGTWINTQFMLTNEMPHGGMKSCGYGKDMSM